MTKKYCRNGHERTTENLYDDGSCKICARERSMRWYKDNPEKCREADRRWREANPEKYREASSRWYKDNLEKCRYNKLIGKTPNIDFINAQSQIPYDGDKQKDGDKPNDG